MTSSKLSLAASVRDEILSHARDGAVRDPPEEVCGVLVGDRTTDSVSASLPVSNVADEPRVAYELDPAETVAAFDEAEDAGDEVVGFYHSHPDSAPVPSATDREQASWPGYVYRRSRPSASGSRKSLCDLLDTGNLRFPLT
ncbi:desampylase [Haloferax sp. S1W]|uniref:desampylase n=1 Tax=Haloferax sp. S1W TaxID=3377110 RepID=UPI0037C51D3B